LTHSEPRIATLGAALTANKGAASMLLALIDNLPAAVGACQIDVLTTYPRDDREELERTSSALPVRIVSCRPWQLVFPMLPLALLVALSRKLGSPGRWLCLTPAMKALADADVVADLAGISFSDGRGLPILAYNTLMTGIPVLMGIPVVKCSQAMGPFREPKTRLAAKVVLRSVRRVLARGQDTYQHLSDLGEVRAEQSTDLAYLLSVPDSAHREAQQLIDGWADNEDFVILIPSTVVRRYCEARQIPYLDIMCDFVRKVNAQEHRLLVLPHAARPNRSASHMNDLPLVRQIGEKVGGDQTLALDRDLGPRVLRTLIGRSEAVITARFHGLISALATGTPALVIGWSHKYREVLQDFGLEEWAMDYHDLNADDLFARYGDLLAARQSVRAAINRHLPDAIAEAHRNIDAMAEFIDRPGNHNDG